MTQSGKSLSGKRKLATHPLCGANLATLCRVFMRSGGIQMNRLGDLGMIAGSALVRWPFDWIERAMVRGQAGKQSDARPPVFILGHWRSGTTHLYNILSKSDSFGYLPPIATGIPWNMLTLGRWLEPLLVKTLPDERFIDNVPVQPDSPQEDEIALANMVDISFYHGLYFPSHFKSYFRKGVFFDSLEPSEISRWCETFTYFMKKLSILQEGRPILVKNPVYTARVRLLRKMYPNATFIHIHRNPYRVYESMKNFYHNLFRELAFQSYDHLSISEIVLENYPLIMDRLIEDTATLKNDQFIELGYDALDNEPLKTLETIYGQLHLGDFNRDRPVFERYLESVKRYRKNKYRYSEETIENVSTRWGRYVDHWGYSKPSLTRKDSI